MTLELKTSATYQFAVLFRLLFLKEVLFDKHTRYSLNVRKIIRSSHATDPTYDGPHILKKLLDVQLSEHRQWIAQCGHQSICGLLCLYEALVGS